MNTHGGIQTFFVYIICFKPNKASKGSNIRKYCGGSIFFFEINKYSNDQSHVIEDHASVVILTFAKDI